MKKDNARVKESKERIINADVEQTKRIHEYAKEMYRHLKQLAYSSPFVSDVNTCECGEFIENGYCQDIDLHKLIAAIDGKPQSNKK